MKWMLFAVAGVGRVAAWIDFDDFAAGESRDIEAKDITLVVAAREGFGFQKIAAEGVINLNGCGLWCDVPEDFVKPLSEVWGKVLLANNGDVPKVNFRA
jgi:hypothetical protein